MSPLRGSRRRHYDPAPMVEPPHDTAAARRAWTALQTAGGLVTNADLRTRWATTEEPLTRQRVQELTSLAGFPEPVVKGGRGSSALWLTAEVDDWRRAYDGRPGRRGPRPRLAGEILEAGEQ